MSEVAEIAAAVSEIAASAREHKLGPTVARRPGTVTALKIVGRGGAAKPAPAGDAAPDWLEF